MGPTAESFPKSCCRSHGAWKPAPNAGFPHSHSDYGDGTCFGRKANLAKIVGPVRFLHRTDKKKGCYLARVNSWTRGRAKSCVQG